MVFINLLHNDQICYFEHTFWKYLSKCTRVLSKLKGSVKEDIRKVFRALKLDTIRNQFLFVNFITRIAVQKEIWYVSFDFNGLV
jgi:hypothetical protein